MDYFAENSAPVIAIGAVLLTMAGIAYLYTRSQASMLAILAILLLTGGGVALERLIVTPREEVQQSLRELLQRIEANDLPGVLARIDAQSTMRADAEHLMPMFDVRKARATGQVAVEMESGSKAQANFKFLADVLHHKSGHKAGYFDNVTIELTKVGDRWVVSGFSTKKDWRKDAAKL